MWYMLKCSAVWSIQNILQCGTVVYDKLEFPLYEEFCWTIDRSKNRLPSLYLRCRSMRQYTHREKYSCMFDSGLFCKLLLCPFTAMPFSSSVLQCSATSEKVHRAWLWFAIRLEIRKEGHLYLVVFRVVTAGIPCNFSSGRGFCSQLLSSRAPLQDTRY